MKKINEKMKAIIRIIAFLVLAINAALAMKGISPIPFDETQVYQLCSDILALAAAIWIWWKNNNMTKAAVKAQEVLNGIKEDGMEGEGNAE